MTLEGRTAVILRWTTAAFAALLIILTWAYQEYRLFVEKPLALAEAETLYTIAPGSSLANIAADLERRGYLDNALYLRLLARMRGDAARIKAGEYSLSRGLTPPQMLDLFVAGRVTTYSITVIEGWTFRQLLAEVAAHPALEHTLAGLPPEEVMGRLGYEGTHPEGRFLPDTYNFPKGTTDASFLKRAYLAMQERLAAEWPDRAPDLPLETPYEVLILASIIEKETGLADERPQIAGVFTRRLKRGMKLQTDPTVIYGMGDRYDGNIRRRDLQEDTPYNTYVHAGLTPTPICLPGADAIHAALHPEEGKSLYFVARGDGSHHFSATLKEHNAAVRKYQLKR